MRIMFGWVLDDLIKLLSMVSMIRFKSIFTNF